MVNAWGELEYASWNDTVSFRIPSVTRKMPQELHLLPNFLCLVCAARLGVPLRASETTITIGQHQSKYICGGKPATTAQKMADGRMDEWTLEKGRKISMDVPAVNVLEWRMRRKVHWASKEASFKVAQALSFSVLYTFTGQADTSSWGKGSTLKPDWKVHSESFVKNEAASKGAWKRLFSESIRTVKKS